MPLFDFAIHLDANAPEPLSLQLARLLAREILEGRLLPGAAMPSSRSLAEELNLSRHVAMSAVRELELEGWVQSHPGSGTYVAEHPPTAIPRAWGRLPERPPLPEAPPFELSSQLRPVSTLASSMLELSDGFPDARLAPKEALARGYRRALQRHGDDLLGLGESRGNRSLREALAQYLRENRGLRITPENLLITRGTPMGLGLVAAALAGDAAVENPGDPAAWEALRPYCRLHPVSVDGEGLVPEALEELLDRQPISLLCVTPQRHFPTTVALATPRRARLMELARIHDFAVVEVDSDLEYAWDAAPRLPLAAEDPEGRVIHLGSLAHLLAPGLGLGYLVAPSALVDRLARLRQRLDIQGDRVLEWSVADLLRDGDLERHLARARRVYRERRDAFLDGLREELGPESEGGFRFPPPEGGLACWVELPPGLDAEAWCSACQRASLKVHPGSRYEFSGRPLSGLRLGFAHLEPEEARRALGLLGRALPRDLHA
jgi:GntR family transcriptional regulator/MocR family aminotransferase